ncbi:hypothetical protein PVL29_011313 [Vitis rotundifolia]|uniref:Inositol oxygenase n=1 Tax=Vitis rotundifolia TaxID=103349 RepID=A0AA38ZN58_VITRO|nr:hypothetical protein PVL29_011313 [Vitis rotundifolia]
MQLDSPNESFFKKTKDRYALLVSAAHLHLQAVAAHAVLLLQNQCHPETPALSPNSIFMNKQKLKDMPIWERSSFLPLEDCFSGLLLVSVLFHMLQLISSSILKNFVISSFCCIAGDTLPGGCAVDESIVHHKYLKENPDDHNPDYHTKYGVYSEGCGLENVMMSWGHDDYMYLVAKENKTTLPAAGLSVIIYHSFWSDAYKHLMDEEDIEDLKWLKIFKFYHNKLTWQQQTLQGLFCSPFSSLPWFYLQWYHHVMQLDSPNESFFKEDLSALFVFVAHLYLQTVAANAVLLLQNNQCRPETAALSPNYIFMNKLKPKDMPVPLPASYSFVLKINLHEVHAVL